MASGFSIILQDAEFRRIVDDNVIASKAWAGLQSNNIFRAQVSSSEAFGEKVGDRKSFTRDGHMPIKSSPIAPRTDATIASYPIEQWDARLGMYGQATETHLPTNAVAAIPRITRDVMAVCKNAGASLNRAARNKLFNAGMAGHSVVSGAVTASTSVPVKRLAGFTRARRPDLTAGEPVRYDPVSSTNPLAVQIYDNSNAFVAYSVTAFSPTNVGDEFGPGTLTLSAAVTCSDRAAIRSSDRSTVVRSGGGDKVDSLATSDKMTLADVTSVQTAFKNCNSPKFADGTYHLLVDATQMGQLLQDTDFKNLHESRGMTPGEPYADQIVKRAGGFTFYDSPENPQSFNVVGAGASYSMDDTFGGELFADGTTGAAVHRAIAIADEAFYEYYIDSAMTTAAGMLGTVNMAQQMAAGGDGYDLAIDHVLVYLRPPLDLLQTMMHTTWRFIGDWCCATDGAVNVGGNMRYKRLAVIESGAVT